MVKKTELEVAFLGLIRMSPYLRDLHMAEPWGEFNSHGYLEEFRFHERKWRFDVAWVKFRLAVEIEGGVWPGKDGQVGRHLTGKGFEADAEKYNEAAVLGWLVLRFPGKFIEDQSALDVVERAVKRIVEG